MADASTKQLLAISWDMPPILMPRSIQVSRILKCLAELGWQTTVLCTSTQALDKRITIDASLEDAYRGAYHPIRVDSLEGWLPLRALERFFLVNHSVWIFRALAQGRKLLNSGDFSAIVSFAHPWASHLVGLRLRLLSGLPWVAHFSDPWVDSHYLPFNPLKFKINRLMEEAVIREADAVIFITAQTAEAVMRKYPPEWREKAHVMPHGFDPALLERVNLSSTPHPRLRMVLTGRFYRGRLTPEGLLQALQVLQRTRPLAQQLEVRLIGPFATSYQPLVRTLGLEAVVTCRGEIPHGESMQEAAAADVLLVIEGPTSPSLILPNKLVEYLVFRKPILGLVPGEGPAADLLRQLGCYRAAPDDPGAIARAVAELLDLWQAGNLAVSTAFAEVAQQYDIRQTIRILDRALLEVISKRPPNHGF
jgi:glycosyltransferase involved in cell wall biosynthesis